MGSNAINQKRMGRNDGIGREMGSGRGAGHGSFIMHWAVPD